MPVKKNESASVSHKRADVSIAVAAGLSRRFPVMSRKYIDCRDFPSEKNCTVAIFGTEDEVLDLAVMHAVARHGHTDTHDFRNQLRSMLKDASESNSAADGS
jgi:Protein of unknown function (DUF1059)